MYIHNPSLSQHTPLMLACTKGKPEVVKVLLHHGADVTQREKEIEVRPGQEEEEQETLNSLELAIENGRRYSVWLVYTTQYSSPDTFLAHFLMYM